MQCTRVNIGGKGHMESKLWTAVSTWLDLVNRVYASEKWSLGTGSQVGYRAKRKIGDLGERSSIFVFALHPTSWKPVHRLLESEGQLSINSHVVWTSGWAQMQMPANQAISTTRDYDSTRKESVIWCRFRDKESVDRQNYPNTENMGNTVWKYISI